MNENRITRIKMMESYLDETDAALRELSKALGRYESIRDKYYALEKYYGSSDWRSDFEADEAGILPDDLKRGVLSEDAVYNLITEHEDLMSRLEKAIK
jgi:hypothetical protein